MIETLAGCWAEYEQMMTLQAWPRPVRELMRTVFYAGVAAGLSRLVHAPPELRGQGRAVVSIEAVAGWGAELQAHAEAARVADW